MKQKRIREVVRKYVQELIKEKVGEERGWRNQFEAMSGIPGSSLTDIMEGNIFITWGMLASISSMESGPTISTMFGEIAKRLVDAELEERRERPQELLTEDLQREVTADAKDPARTPPKRAGGRRKQADVSDQSLASPHTPPPPDEEP